MRDRPPLLFIAPVLPSPTGNGLAMRQHLFLEALSSGYAVHLHVVRLFSPTGDEGAVAGLQNLCVSVTTQKAEDDPEHSSEGPFLTGFASSASVDELVRQYANISFSGVHVGRLYLTPFARPFRTGTRGTRPWLSIDLDDYESELHRRLARLHELRDEEAAAAFEEIEATKYARLEEAELPKADRVYLASAKDLDPLEARLPGVNLVHVPNAVRLPPRSPRPSPSGRLHLLLVGTMGYLPNEDAASFFIKNVLPLIQSGTELPVYLTVVGPLPSPALQQLARSTKGVVVTGAVADLRPYYEDADVAVVPLRAGGGTRIKILEAFSLGCPVVATRLGADGIEAENEEHLLLADSPEELAKACLRLLQDPMLGSALATRASALVRRRYAHDVVIAFLQKVIAGIDPDQVPIGLREGGGPKHPN
jgi:glycosyltransferase involved in cell wall biosynthesis